MSDTRPNILFIMSDEHDAANMGCYGDPLGATPHLDDLASRGVAFDHCYCNSPLCVPSRLSFTACQYISRCGAWSNANWLPSDDVPSIARVLGAAGYEPWLCGKQHYDKTRRYGFNELLGAGNHAHKSGRGGRRAAGDLTPNLRSWEDRSAGFGVGGYDDNYVLQQDVRVTDTASGFLRGRSPDDAPFFLFAGYIAPHFPLVVPQELFDRFRGRVPAPTIPDGLIDSLPLNYKHLRAGFGVTETDSETIRRGRDCYWALTAWFDGLVGQLLGALADSRVADNTIVVYTSDHGENKGDHGLWWKNCMYDHGARVPLIVSWPERWAGGQRRTGVCSLVDVVRTVVDWAGGEPDPGWDGDSMAAYLDDAATPWKNLAVSEYYGHNIASGFTMFRGGRWKYVYHNAADAEHPAERQLFDMEADPLELNDLAGDPAQAERIEELHASMLIELGEDPDSIEQRCRADLARGYER